MKRISMVTLIPKSYLGITDTQGKSFHGITDTIKRISMVTLIPKSYLGITDAKERVSMVSVASEYCIVLPVKDSTAL
jgi:hypothetical protein